MIHRLGLFALGVVLGGFLFLATNVTGSPAPPKCPTCYFLTHPYGGCNEAVQGGGYICP